MPYDGLEDGKLLSIQRGKINAMFQELYSIKLEAAQVLTRTNTSTFTPTQDYHPCTKLYADELRTNWDTVFNPQEITGDVFDRENHTGTQLPGTIATDFSNRFITDAERLAWNSKEDDIGVKGTAFNTNYGTTAGTTATGDHEHTKADINLGNVDNTSDVNKPISTLQQVALDLKANIIDVYTRVVLDLAFSLKRDLTDFIFGDFGGGNYSEFEADGTLKAIGDAQTWDDLQVVLTGVELHPTQSPVWINYKGSRALEFSSGLSQTIYFIAQVPHTWAEGTDINFHLHAIHQEVSTGTVIWDFTHSWANIGDAFPTETTVQKEFATHTGIDIHGVGGVAELAGVNKKISSIILCSLTRRGDIDTSSGDSVLIGADFHHLINTLGSRHEYIK